LFKESFFNSYCTEDQKISNDVVINNKIEDKNKEHENEEEKENKVDENYQSVKKHKPSESPVIQYEQNQSRISEFRLINKEKSNAKSTIQNKDIYEKRINKLKKEIKYDTVDYGTLDSIYIAMCFECQKSSLYSKYKLLQEINDAMMNMDLKLLVDGILDVRKLKDVLLEEAADEIHKIPNSKYLTIHSKLPNQNENIKMSKLQKELEVDYEEEYEEEDEEVKGEIIIIEKSKIKQERVDTIKKKKKKSTNAKVINPESKDQIKDLNQNPGSAKKSKFYGTKSKEDLN
jgi:hypothetical protein